MGAKIYKCKYEGCNMKYDKRNSYLTHVRKYQHYVNVEEEE